MRNVGLILASLYFVACAKTSGAGRCSLFIESISGAANDLCPNVATLPALPVPEVGVNARSYAGSLPACGGRDPLGAGFSMSLSVENVVVTEVPASGLTLVSIQGESQDNVGPCGDALSVSVPYSALPGGGPGISVDLKVGDALVFSHRTTQVTDNEARDTQVIARSDGSILLAVMTGVRPDFFDGDLVPRLTLAVPRENICAGGHEGRFSLQTGSDPTCSVESRSQQCCTLWSRSYEVQSQAAIVYVGTPPSAAPWAAVNVALRQTGFFVRKP